jgi:hypothetical protein
MERIMKDTSTLRTSLLSHSTSHEVIIGDDVFLMEQVWRGRDNHNSTVVWLRDGDMLKKVDDATKEWLISSIEAKEHTEIPF